MTDKPHLIMICPACGGTGAVANVALHQARELARCFRVTLLSDTFPTAGLEGVAFQPLNATRFGWLRRFGHVPREIAFALSAKSAIGQLHANAGVAVVLCHGHAVAALAAAPLRRRVGIPYAMVTHGDIFDRPKGTYDARLTWFYRLVTPPAYHGASLVVTLSPYMRELALRGGAGPGRVVVIPNGIDPAEIGLDDQAPPPPRAATCRAELLYVGRLSVEKGVDVLMDAAARLKAQGLAFRLRLAGSGPRQAPLRAQAARLGLDGYVEFLGSVPRLELGALYRSADLVCVPSRSDPLPTVVLEAMVAGAAVVGTDRGGIPFMIEQGVTGLVCAADNDLALAAALARVMREAGLAQRMGEAGRRRVAREFNWTRVIELLGAELATLGSHPTSRG